MDLTDLGTAVFAILGVAAGFVPWLFPNASRRTKAIAVFACIALIAVALRLGMSESNKANISADEVRSATQVRACMTQHKMSEAETVMKLPPRRNEEGTTEYVTLYKKCLWPPPSWASPDGHSEIRVTDTDGPGEAEASGTNVADVIKSRCSELYLRYSLVAQGAQEPDQPPGQPFVSKPNRVVLYTGEEYRSPGPGTGLPFYYEPDELVVLRNMKYRLDEVRCEK